MTSRLRTSKVWGEMKLIFFSLDPAFSKILMKKLRLTRKNVSSPDCDDCVAATSVESAWKSLETRKSVWKLIRISRFSRNFERDHRSEKEQKRGIVFFFTFSSSTLDFYDVKMPHSSVCGVPCANGGIIRNVSTFFVEQFNHRSFTNGCFLGG